MTTIETVATIFKKHLKSIIVGSGALALLLLGYYSFFKYRQEKDLLLGQQINTYENALLQIESAETMTLANEERLEQIKIALSKIHRDNKGLKNALRAQYVLAKIDYKNGDTEGARKKFLSIFEYNKKHYLAPLALMQAAAIFEAEVLYDKAIALLEDHQLYYIKHFTEGQALISLARNYELQGQYVKAAQTLQSITENQDLSNYHPKAEEGLDLLILKGYLKAVTRTGASAGSLP